MSDGTIHDKTARLTAFATAGALTVAQEIASAILSDIEGADSNVVAEETLCLLAVVTGRAIEASGTGVGPVVPSVIGDLPLLYRDYIIGGVLLEHPDFGLDADQSIYHRLARARSFYVAHFPAGQFPGPRALSDKMSLWMGRVSPPRLPELPVDRLKRMGLVDRVSVHTRLVLEYARQIDSEDATTGE